VLVGGSGGWHLLGLAGLTAFAAAGALARHDRRRRVVVPGLAGLILTAIALDIPPG
jgi:hypothetical protein